MSNQVNHRRKNKPKVNRRYTHYNNGYARHTADDRYGDGEPIYETTSEKHSLGRVGRTGYLDKSMHHVAKKSVLADVGIVASIGNDFSNGHRGKAKAVRGAKKFVRTRIRFHENAETKRLANDYPSIS